MDITATRAVLAGLLGKPVLTIARIGKGGNSKVYRIDCDDGSRYVAKFYFQRTADGLDRLDVEFSSMQMLWEAGERNVPEPLVADRANQINNLIAKLQLQLNNDWRNASKAKDAEKLAAAQKAIEEHEAEIQKAVQPVAFKFEISK